MWRPRTASAMFVCTYLERGGKWPTQLQEREPRVVTSFPEHYTHMRPVNVCGLIDGIPCRRRQKLRPQKLYTCFPQHSWYSQTDTQHHEGGSCTRMITCPRAELSGTLHHRSGCGGKSPAMAAPGMPPCGSAWLPVFKTSALLSAVTGSVRAAYTSTTDAPHIASARAWKPRLDAAIASHTQENTWHAQMCTAWSSCCWGPQTVCTCEVCAMGDPPTERHPTHGTHSCIFCSVAVHWRQLHTTMVLKASKAAR